MNKEATDSEQMTQPSHQATIPRFVIDDDIGLGDVIKRVTQTFGIKSCRGCERRAAALNRWFVFTGRAR